VACSFRPLGARCFRLGCALHFRWCKWLAASGRSVPGASGSAVPSTSGGVSGLQLPAASVHQHLAASCEEEGEADFDLMSSSSVEEQDESQSLHWSDVVSAVRAFHPEVVAADGAASAVWRAWSAPATSTSAQRVDSPLFFQETEKASTRLCYCGFEGLRSDSSELSDFPAAKGIGNLLTCAKRRGLFRSAVNLDLLPKEKLKASRHDLALAGRLESIP
jgi:hypothetical protein